MIKFNYLTVVLSNCTWNGSTFLTDQNLFTLEEIIRNNFKEIPQMEFRGIGCSMVRGNVNSLTLGIAAGCFQNKQQLDELLSEILKINIRNSISSISGLAFSEIRIETSLIGKTKSRTHDPKGSGLVKAQID